MKVALRSSEGNSGSGFGLRGDLTLTAHPREGPWVILSVHRRGKTDQLSTRGSRAEGRGEARQNLGCSPRSGTNFTGGSKKEMGKHRGEASVETKHVALPKRPCKGFGLYL